MFTITAKEDNRIDIEFSGKLDSEAMQSALEALPLRQRQVVVLQ